MRVTKLDIINHNDSSKQKYAIYSVDIQPCGDRLATAGGGTVPRIISYPKPYIYCGVDATVKLWSISKCLSSVDLAQNSLLAVIGNHSKSINIVRWSKSGDILASGSDDSLILIYRQYSSVTSAESEGNRISASKVQVYH